MIEELAVSTEPSGLLINDLCLSLGGKPILQDIKLSLPRQGVVCLLGPSGAGKSSLLRCINGLEQGWVGDIKLLGSSIRMWPGGWDKLRRDIGFIAQKPSVFPASIRANVLFGLSRSERRRSEGLLERCLIQAALLDEVMYRLDEPATSLSLGQQQRLCIARALAIQPNFLLMDEPTASLDPASKQLIEKAILDLADKLLVVCVTHDIDQARRLGGSVVFMKDGRALEQNESVGFFVNPESEKLESA